MQLWWAEETLSETRSVGHIMNPLLLSPSAVYSWTSSDAAVIALVWFTRDFDDVKQKNIELY